MPERDIYDNISPVDYRYWDEDVAHYCSENAFTHYKLLVEATLVKVLCRRLKLDKSILQEVEDAYLQVKTSEVYAEEKRTKHDIRALVNCIRAKVSDEVKPLIHMTATSYDIVDTANAARYKDVSTKVIIPVLYDLEQVLIELALREAKTTQIGRTHGQHAVPITFGFAIAEYVHRLGGCIVKLDALTDEIAGKFSGAVGAYNASSLFFDDPEEFEREIMNELNLKPAEYSTQIVPPEPMMRFLNELVITSGVLANLSRDMRNLQRTEIGEVGEPFSEDQVGSSTMAQKQNPINFENAESMWKNLVGRIVTVYLDQVSEHQRDLTNSASSRTYGEIIDYLVSMAKRLTKVMGKLEVNKLQLSNNLCLQQGLIAAEPLYLTLAALGHPNAHEKVRQLTMTARLERRTLQILAQNDPELKPYWEKMTDFQKEVIIGPTKYRGIAPEKAVKIAQKWNKV